MSDTADTTPTSHPSRRRWPWIALATIVLLVAAIRVALPPVIESLLESQASQAIGLDVQVDDIDLALLSGRASLELGSVARTPGPIDPESTLSPLFDIERAEVEIRLADLLDRRIHLEEVILTHPRLIVLRDPEGRIDPLGEARPVPPDEEATDEDAEADGESVWPIEIDELVVRGIEVDIDEAGVEERVLLDFDLQELRVTDVRIVGESIELGTISLAGPTLGARRDLFVSSRGAADARPAAATAAPAASASSTAPGPTGTGEGVDVEVTSPAAGGPRIAKLAIRQAELVMWTDTQPIELEVTLEADDVVWTPGLDFPLQLDVTIGEGTLALAGRLGLDPMGFEGTLSWKELPLPLLATAADPALEAWLRKSRSFGELAIDALLEPGGVDGPVGEPGIEIRGTTEIRELEFANPGEDVEIGVRLERLATRIERIRVPLGATGAPQPIALHLGSLELVDPRIRYTHPPTALDALVPSEAGSDTDPTAPGPAIDARLDALRIEAGRVVVLDRSVTPGFGGSIQGLSLTGAGIGWPELRARQLRAEARIFEDGRLAFDGGLEADSGQLELEIEQLPLEDLNPYLTAMPSKPHFAAGTLSLGGSGAYRNGRFDSTSRLVLSELDIDRIDEDGFVRTYGVSLNVALALLQGPRGNIALDLPLSVDADGVSAGLATVLRGALRSALIGALAAPLKLLGAVNPLGDDGSADPGIPPVAFPAGEVTLSHDERARLVELAGLLEIRPQLAVAIEPQVATDDRRALALALLAQRFAEGSSVPDVAGDGLLARRRIENAVTSRAAGAQAPLDPEDEALLERYLGAIEVPAARFEELGRDRAQAILGVLRAEGITSDQLRTRAVQADGSTADGPPAVALRFDAVGLDSPVATEP